MTVRILSQNSYAQSVGAYKSISSGDFDDILIWEVFDGSSWNASTLKPGANNDVYIAFGHHITLQQNEAVKSLYLNAELSTGEKIDINDFDLEVYGSLNAFEGTVPGTARGAWNTIDWIGSSVNSQLVFKGSSRVVIPSGAWSAFSTRSQYTMVFDPDPGEEFRVQEAVKANKFVIKSGKVIQEGVPGVDCASFSFNNDPAITGAYGDLIIENGASLESDCSEGILFRSASGLVPASLLDLEDGAELIFNANNPEINAATINFDGTVYYSANSGTQNFVVATMTGAVSPSEYTHLIFEGNAQKNLPQVLEIKGNMEWFSGGSIVDNITALTVNGANNQSISGFPLSVTDLEINKSTGILDLDNDLEIMNDFLMIQGEIDFANNDLFINSGGAGSYSYVGGNWHNLYKLSYNQLPISLNSLNATFPFVDKYEGGTRKVQLLGSHTALNSALLITYQQIPYVDHQANFTDNDGTLILYQLNSYFTINASVTDNSDLVLKISADDLIVDNVDDIRIVGDHIAAAGEHLAAEDNAGEFFARRELSLSEMNGKDFTIGSYAAASILPLNWLSYFAKKDGTDNLVCWATEKEQDLEYYEVYRSIMGVDKFDKIGQTLLKSKFGPINYYTFKDSTSSTYPQVYYRIGAVDKFGEIEFSPTFGLRRSWLDIEGLKIYPNPYSSGDIHFELPEDLYSKRMRWQIKNIQGIELLLFDGSYKEIRNPIIDILKKLPSGIYIVSIFTYDEVLTIKWIKK